MKKEIRASARAISAVEGNSVSGYFAKFNKPSQDLGGFVEVLAKGCFADSLVNHPDVAALVDHDTAKILARTASNTLSVREDDTGLAFSIANLPNTSYANDLKESLKREDITGCSFGFYVENPNDETWEVVGNDVVRTVLRATLIEGSIVTFPAYLDTNANLRAASKADAEELRALYASRIAEARSKAEVDAANAAAAQAEATAKALEASALEDAANVADLEVSGAAAEVVADASHVAAQTAAAAEQAADVAAAVEAIAELVVAEDAAEARTAPVEETRGDVLGDIQETASDEDNECECSCDNCEADNCDMCSNVDCVSDRCVRCAMQGQRAQKVELERSRLQAAITLMQARRRLRKI